MEKDITQKTTEELQQRIDELTKENKILAENNSKLNTTLSRQSSRISALSDEVHQLFVEGRSCEFRDWAIDSFGAILGIIGFIIIFKIWYNIKVTIMIKMIIS